MSRSPHRVSASGEEEANGTFSFPQTSLAQRVLTQRSRLTEASHSGSGSALIEELPPTEACERVCSAFS